MIHRGDVPEVSCIYVLFRASECIYVGSTINLKSRVGSHVLRNVADRIEFFECAPCDLCAAEMYAMEELRPTMNKVRDARRAGFVYLYPYVAEGIGRTHPKMRIVPLEKLTSVVRNGNITAAIAEAA